MTTTNLGRIYWALDRAENGVRTYTVRYRIETDSKNTGPNEIADVLPSVGSTWNIGNDTDTWVFATPYLKVTPQVDGEPNFRWIAEMKYESPEPPEQDGKRCFELEIANPLQEPDKIGGSFAAGAVKATKDKDGNPIVTRSFEDPQVEFEEAYAEVRITQNRLDLQIETLAQLQNRVNAAKMWGMEPRTIRLSNVSWERKVYGICTYYYTRTLTFVVNYNTWDRSDVPNLCTKMIDGEWDTSANPPTYAVRAGAGWDADNAQQYIEAVDHKENKTRFYLADDGSPLTGNNVNYVRVGYDGNTDPIKYYKEANFFSLGIPTVL